MRFKFAALALLLPVAGCATIINGTSQDIAFLSQPTSAAVTVDGQPRGTTPVTVSLARSDNHTVRIALPGYQPYEMILTRKASGWVWGNLISWWLVGFAVDAVSGGLYQLTPDQVAAQLQRPTQASMSSSEGKIFVVLVAEPDPTWVRVGTLTPVGP